MSAIIKGIKKPRACEWCNFICGSGMDWYCGVGRFMIYDYKSVNKDCPLINIPTPHGDLIDRDDVIEEINRIFPCHSDEYEWAYTTVEQADTIIEAEQGDG